MASQFNLGSVISLSQAVEFFGRAGRFGLKLDAVRRLLGDDELMRCWIAALDPLLSNSRPVHGRFTDPQSQIEIVRGWNRGCGWGIPEEEFTKAARSIPMWPEGRLVAVTLVPYLRAPAGSCLPGIAHTVRELLIRARVAQGATVTLTREEELFLSAVNLIPGHERVFGGQLCWEVVDFGSFLATSVEQVFDADVDLTAGRFLPGAAVFAAAALHPAWIRQMAATGGAPFVCVPGLRASPLLCSSVFVLDFTAESEVKLRTGTRSLSFSDPRCSVPTYVRTSR